ncbi:hypothetical protein WICMUC_005532 [Wickerhamomyces mucosus]|uniref:Uncharacterized protein n=1 Tax=Wickerhamomyces mucosus TaxID=1378264 RepID=A0A9P8P813_9ASCO|nr:hypothetical protein WICMUC_005532 [Wickerhamomyces mucosus]
MQLYVKRRLSKLISLEFSIDMFGTRFEISNNLSMNQPGHGVKPLLYSGNKSSTSKFGNKSIKLFEDLIGSLLRAEAE